MKSALMVWGASSGAGKSLLTTALCRWAAREGASVAPFKAQNMSNNARVVPVEPPDLAGDEALGEIGSAQYFQALAARVAPHADLNPVLLKPERDTASQVVVRGLVDETLSRMAWRERSGALAAAAQAGFERLATRHDLIILEGAGSPAEINLAPQDYVNLGASRWARQLGRFRAIVVADIDRGGAFAHLHGTWSLLPEDLRGSLAGFVLNKFRGDASLLAPGPARLQAMTGVPLLGTIPMQRDHGLPDEDGLTAPPPRHAGAPRIAIVAWPHLSNLDEFQPLAAVANVTWAREPADLEQADWIILPGSKQVSGDLAWLRARGLVEAIERHARQGRPLLGICGGMQMLGQTLEDPGGADGQAHGPIPGLGLLPLATVHAAPKRLRAAAVRLGPLTAPWNALCGLTLPAYEIRCGRTQPVTPRSSLPAALLDADGQAIGWQGAGADGAPGNILGIAAHGLFEDAGVIRALFGRDARTLDDTFEFLADLVQEHLGEPALRMLLQM